MSLLKNINKTSRQISKSSEDYVDATKEYIELKTFQQLSIAFSLLFKSFIIGSLLFVSFIVLIIEGVLICIDLFNNVHYALLFISGILFVITLLVYIYRKPLIESRVIKMVSKTFFSKS
ncbi:hypothetical protein AXE80_04605 [Wenyingzhuangia fucanilytica]|uniref:Competence protein n=1 Tax=Wenyingzhuangia fucanilytica TaxID=1790137 RepID=A0A1B1Y4D0_9FLAO|nr:hypothetical protein [Wenyingzhuangia fucanilytica]ANW95599.1 hypothetical protein AXE80_04605 [Wenyingzhuangia fucanilytica]